MGLDEDLLRDLDSDLDDSSEEEDGVEQQKPPVDDGDKDGDDDVDMERVSGQLNGLMESQQDLDTEELLGRVDMSAVKDITKLSKLRKKLQPMLAKIDEFTAKLISKRDEQDFLMKVSDVSVEITNEQTMVHNFIKTHYKKRFPELESLVPNMIEYAQIIKTLQNDIHFKEGSLPFINKEKNLVIAMASIQAQESTQPLTEQELTVVLKACDLLLELQQDKLKVEQYMGSRLAVFAPNLSAIIGPYSAAQLMSAVGGLGELVATPSCNVAALGNKRAVSIGLGHSGIRQQGILYYSELIQDVSDDLKKQAMRIAAGKLILAARVDQSNGSPNGALGKKWRKEIEEKIEKLEEPPEIAPTKALPIPEDKKSKKRGGRRQRKLKAKFELSELRKAQDRVEFGKQEKTITDGFGKEVGLGMMGSLSHIQTNTLNKVKVSKAMKNRLEKSNASANEFFNQDLINLPAPPPPKSLEQGAPPSKRIKR